MQLKMYIIIVKIKNLKKILVIKNINDRKNVHKTLFCNYLKPYKKNIVYLTLNNHQVLNDIILIIFK